MSEVRIQRLVRSVSVTLSTSVNASSTLRMDDLAGGVVSVAPLSGPTSALLVYSSVEADGPYRRVYKADGTSVEVAMAHGTAAGAVYALPDEVYALPHFRLVAAGAAAGGVAATVTLKS